MLSHQLGHHCRAASENCVNRPVGRYGRHKMGYLFHHKVKKEAGFQAKEPSRAITTILRWRFGAAIYTFASC